MGKDEKTEHGFRVQRLESNENRTRGAHVMLF